MASRGGLVAIGAIGLSLAALFAFAGKAKADPKGQTTTPDDYSPEACAAYKSQKQGLVARRNAIQGYIVEIDAARIEAAQNDDDARLAELDAIRAGQVQARNGVTAQINALDAKIAKC